MNRPIAAPCKPVKLSLDASVVAKAEALGLNLSRIMEEALRSRIREEKVRRWQADRAEAVRLSNEELGKNGLWSDEHRLF
ncbi:MAG TPA: type II toxin-antitoxin system CcdA family antitoxin [Beijerinckiaceae bacterium]|nr:type II toxin-antitoxin system CcdA family antitoxin [Beijerinckiaceae bacterium]